MMRKQQQGVAFQESEAQKETAPEDVKYRLEPLPKTPLGIHHLGYFRPHGKSSWLHFSTSKPWKLEPVSHHGEKPSYSAETQPGDYHMTTTHQISFQSPPLGQSMFPVPIQGRKIAPITRPGYIEYINQYRSDFQAPGWSQIFEPDPAKSCGQEINKYIQTRRDTALSLQPATRQQPKPSWLKQEMPILAAKFGGDTVSRVKCPSSLSKASPAA
ncbi:uncharacterized protein [Vicugna pacos]|uniref:Testis-expressed protein 26 n=1 Tax=Vicugna pacos TaxID=30538 RepID=A0ABM5CML6_VICPA